jgi:hypothetical protein
MGIRSDCQGHPIVEDSKTKDNAHKRREGSRGTGVDLNTVWPAEVFLLEETERDER